MVRELLFGGGLRRPSKPIPVVSEPAGPAAEGLAVTWYGHASTLVEIEGRRLVFRVEAYDEQKKIGEGIHERFIVNLERFLKRIAQ